MKNRVLPAAFAFTLLLAGRPAPAAEPTPAPPTITTSGSAELHVPADLADLHFDVAVRHADLATARKQHADRATKVLAALRAAGIEDKDLQTTQVNIEPTYAESRHGETAAVKYYDITQSFVCTLRDLKKVADVTTQVINAGATAVHEADLRTSELRKYQNEAHAQAARDAREKAVALATELGAKVGKPFTITAGGEDTDTSSSSNFQATEAGTTSRSNAPAEDSPQTIYAAGLLKIRASVNVVFYLE